MSSKRLLDLTVIVLVAVPALVIAAACAIAIKATSPGPVFFRQERVGLNGRSFWIWKFRTMIDGDNPIIPSDERITSTGRMLRRTSLDELPQLINVIRGEMSLVGPRPTLRYQAERWTPRQRRRLDERPGLTGLAQISGRNELSWTDRIELDLDYLERRSLRLDVQILALTVAAVFAGSGSTTTSADDPLAQVAEA